MFRWEIWSHPKFLVAMDMASSRTEAERLIKAGAVRWDGEKVTALYIGVITEIDGQTTQELLPSQGI